MVREPEKFQNAVWLPMDEPPAKLTSVLTHGLEAWQKGKFFSQFPKMKKKSDALILPSVIELSDIKTEKKAAKKPIAKPPKKEAKKAVDKKEGKKTDKKAVKKEGIKAVKKEKPPKMEPPFFDI